MKTIKNAAKSAFIAGFILFFAGCRTTKNEPFYTVKEHQSLPPVMTEVNFQALESNMNANQCTLEIPL